MQSNTDVQDVLVLEPDPLCGAMIAQTAGAVFPSARIHCETLPAEAAAVLAERQVSLFIVTLRRFDFDILTLLGVWAEHDTNCTRVLVITPDATSSAVAALQSLPIHGIVDLRQTDFQELERAFRTVAGGATYWSRSALAPADRCSNGVRRAGGVETFRRTRVDGPGIVPRWRRRFDPPVS